MGMDVYGKSPANETGKYFRNSCWSWRPLWDYVCQVGNLSEEVKKAGHYNDGAGLRETESRALAAQLQLEIESGRTGQYASAYKKSVDAVQDEDCNISRCLFWAEARHDQEAVQALRACAGYR